ncbi:MAG: hypothetical protein PHC88_05605 [Terrimicrobiaceae bacterium]|nr:hypothetical protein [Terrimicrobiaceae bacterium]
MAVPATAIFECNAAATALNVNGAGFDPGNASMATDLTTDANTANTNAPIVSSASYNFVAGDVGKWLYIQSGTNWTPGWYPITAVSSNKATLNATIGAAIQRDTAKGYPTPKFLTNTVAGCATVGTPTSGVWSIDYSQGTAAIATATDLASDGAGAVSSATRTFGVNDVGNCIHITAAGTGLTLGWFFISSVAAGVATLDRSPGLSKTGGTWYEGGAASLNSNTANQTDTNFSAVPVAGNFIFGTGALTLQALFQMNAGTFIAPIRFIGYTTNRGTTPTGSGRPTISCAANGVNGGNYNHILNWITTGSSTSVISHGGSGGGYVSNSKVTNISVTAARAAILLAASDVAVNCEAVSYRGRAISGTSGGDKVLYCYAHDSDVGIFFGGANPTIHGNIVESCVTSALNVTVNNGHAGSITGNTLYGAENKLGVGLSLVMNDRSSVAVMNNIFYGFVTAVSQGTTDRQASAFSDFNDYFNNTTDNTLWFKGPNDIAVDPQFASVSQITGTAGKFTAGNDRLVDTTKNFSTLGVVAGRDKVYIISGTGATAGIYGVSSLATTTNPNDTLVLDLSPGTNTTADKVYDLTIGHNFYPKKFMAGFPGAFPASLTTGFSQIGAVPPARLLQLPGGAN